MSAKTIFGDRGQFTSYRGELQVLNRIVGGVPKDPDVIKAWVAARTGLDEPALLEVVSGTYERMVADGEEPSRGDVAEQAARDAYQGNGFKSVDGVLVWEGRCLKAAIREAANIAYPGTDFPGKDIFGGRYRKGLRATVTERVFVREEYLPLGTSAPSATEQRIKHITARAGQASTISVVDIVDKPRIAFTVDVLGDFLPQDVWAEIWGIVEREGIGADRARGDGVCELAVWERL